MVLFGEWNRFLGRDKKEMTRNSIFPFYVMARYEKGGYRKFGKFLYFLNLIVSSTKLWC